MLKIAKENLNALYAKIAESMGLFIPIKKAGEVNYHVWGEGKEEERLQFLPDEGHVL